MQDSFLHRIFNLDDKILVVNVQGTLPIMITNQTFLTNSDLTFKSIKGLEANNFPGIDNLKDTVDQQYFDNTGDRLKVWGTAQSPLTYNNIIFYYDKIYQDILILPDLRGYSLVPAGKKLQVPALRLGGGCEFKLQSLGQLVPTTPANAYKLVVSSGGSSAFTTYLTTIPGINSTEVDKGGVWNRFEEMVDDKYNIYHTQRGSGLIIELGIRDDIFATLRKLPLYLLHQVSIHNYGIDYLGIKDPEANTMYITLKF